MHKTLFSIVAVLALTACVADEPPEVVEPPLTDEELAMLPDGLAFDPEHTHELLAIAGEDEPDAFADDDVTPPYDVEAIPHAPLLEWGLHPRASDALREAGVAAWRITQTIGNAPASAGFHAQDGSVGGAPYSAATDISTSGLTSTQIHNLLERMAKLGFAVWYRKDGVDGWNGANHLHAVYANCKMKSQLRAQVRSFLLGRNGLSSNTVYTWHTFSAAAKQAVRAKFAQSAQGTSNGGAGVSGRVDTSGAALTVRAGASTSSGAVGSVADGSYVTITCQKVGQSVTGTYGTSSLWDYIGSGYVSDAYVATGSDGRVAPDCD